jgi:hypothetical protein
MPIEEQPNLLRTLHELPGRLADAQRRAKWLALLCGLGLSAIILVGGSLARGWASGVSPTRDALMMLASLAMAGGLLAHAVVGAALRIWVRARLVDLVLESLGETLSGLLRTISGPEQVFAPLMHAGSAGAVVAAERAGPAIRAIPVILAALAATGILFGSRRRDGERVRGEDVLRAHRAAGSADRAH